MSYRLHEYTVEARTRATRAHMCILNPEERIS